MPASAAATVVPARLANQANSRPTMGQTCAPCARTALTQQRMAPYPVLPAARTHTLLRGQQPALLVRPILKVVPGTARFLIARAMLAIMWISILS